MESLEALLLGGIAFETPPGQHAAGRPARPTSFPLYANRRGGARGGLRPPAPACCRYFPGSVAGLDVGADVTLHGLKIGEVTDVGLVFDPKLDRIVAPVHYRIDAEPHRQHRVADQGLAPGTLAAEMVKRGFRATLQSPSLITGRARSWRWNALPDAPPAELGRDGDVFVVPSSEGGGFDSITRSANELLSKINRIDFDAHRQAASPALAKGLDDTINGPQIK